MGAYNNIHADIIEKSLKGDTLAQNKLYNLYARSMFNSCLRITNNFDDAEDVLQEAFISAFKNLRSYKGDAAFGAWLKRIVVNKAINFIKKKQKDLVDTEELTDEEVREPDEPQALSVERIKEAMKLLPDGYRVVFSLYLLEGYNHSEIAQILGISESTSKSQFNRSKKKLKEILQKEVTYE